MRRRALLLGLAAACLPGAGAARAPAPALLPEGERADLVLVEKAARRLLLLRRGRVLAEHGVALGFAPVGPKTREGDGRTPEGRYRIDRRNAASAFTLSLGIDYPTEAERRAARARGERPGGDIFIHGQPNGLPEGVTLPGDWTLGCIAVPNPAMREIWARVALRTRVEIRP